MARSSTPSPKPASSWKAGGASTIRFDHTDHWATGPQPRRSSFRSPRGRLRYPNRLRRPRWRPGRTCTNIQLGQFVGGTISLFARISLHRPHGPQRPVNLQPPVGAADWPLSLLPAPFLAGEVVDFGPSPSGPERERGPGPIFD
jgi:hypothetical protein